ncbi:recombinase family protein [Actinomadura sp. RB99]|uniref:recombinase family protein n=1 Tax=Actinomadura sp. RB99 TaxID=2691577 RepID=UPI00168739DD|nr:recombinase family protein [Actinomadura sp. RB99]
MVKLGAGRRIHLTNAEPQDLNARTLCGGMAGAAIPGDVVMTTCGHCAVSAGAEKGAAVSQPPALPAKPETRAVPAEPSPNPDAVRIAADDAIRAARTTGERVVIYVRLSRETEESTSVERQEALCRAFATFKGWDVVAVLSDVDVSGAKPLADREDGAKLLAMISGRKVDHVIAWKLDRFARNAREFLLLKDLVKAHRVGLWTEDGMVNPTTLDLVAPMLAVFAEWEREQIRARVISSHASLRSLGRWHGGAAPYGYVIVKRDGGKYLAEDPETAERVRGWVKRVIEGTRVGTLVAELNADGVLSPSDYARVVKGREARGVKWSDTALRDLLVSPTLTGTLMHDPRSQEEKTDARGRRTSPGRKAMRPMLDAEGNVVKVGPPLITDAEHHAVRAAIEGRTRRHNTRQTDHELLHVARCGVCGGPLYFNACKSRPDASMYKCKRGCGVTVTAKYLSPFVREQVMAVLGDVPMMRRGVEVADVSAEIHATETALANLAEQAAGFGADSAFGKRLQTQVPALEAKLARLQAQQARAGSAEWEPTGETFADVFARRDEAGRCALYHEYGVTVAVAPAKVKNARRFDDTRCTVSISGPEWSWVITGPDDGPDAVDEMDAARDSLTAEEMAEAMDAA